MSMKKARGFYSVLTFLIMAFESCTSTAPAIQPGPTTQPGIENRWNVYGLFDSEQSVIIPDFYTGYYPEEELYHTEDLYFYRNINHGENYVDEYLESEAVYIGTSGDSAVFCIRKDLEGLYSNEQPSQYVLMRVESIRAFSRGLNTDTVVRVRYRYFFRPKYVPREIESPEITNRIVSKANQQGLMDISLFLLDEYEITDKINRPQSNITKGVNRFLDIAGAVMRGADRIAGSILGLDDVVPTGVINLNGKEYQRVGLGEVVKNSRNYTGETQYLTSRVRFLGDRGNNTWAFREGEGNVVQTMKFKGHIPSSMKNVRIYYRLLKGGTFEIDEIKVAVISNDQW